jgi:hypothetical protein
MEMKSLNLALILLMLVSFSASAALAAEKGEVHYGLKAGVSFTTAYAEGGRLNYYTAGAGGIFMNYHLSRNFQIQPELFFSMRGWKETAGSLTLTNKINYIDLNLLLKLVIPSGSETIQSALGIGPFVGIKVSDSYEFNLSVPDEVNEAMDLIYESINSYDVGIIFSGELDVLLDNGGMVVLDFRITVGLTQIFEDIVAADTYQLDLKMLGFQLMAGYAF